MKQIKCEVYSRVCGFFRPINEWNLGKKSEYADRVMYKIQELNEQGEETKGILK